MTSMPDYGSACCATSLKFATASSGTDGAVVEASRYEAVSDVLRQPCAVAGAAVLDALPYAAFILDVRMRVLAANEAAEQMMAEGDPFQIFTAYGSDEAARYLTVTRRADATALSDLVQSTVQSSGAAGGIRLKRLQSNSQGKESPAIIAVVTRLPERRGEREISRPDGRGDGAVLLLARDLSHVDPPATQLLRELFGLSPTEARVAVMVASGITTEAAAINRGVSVATVRAQVRAILDKVGADNLRDLERILASVPCAQSMRSAGLPPEPKLDLA